MSLKDTRETVDSEWRVALFDEYADRAAAGEFSLETAMEIYQHLMETTEKIGATAMGNVAPNRED